MKAKAVFAIAILALLGVAAWQWELDTRWLDRWIGEHRPLGALIYVAVAAGSVVILPFSSLPLLPLAARNYGVITAALLSAAGWWLGALIAFRIARFGRRHLERLVSLEAVDRLEERVPPDIGFAGIAVLRMILPVDIVSFALGLLKRLRFQTYAAASLAGIVPFALVWSYAVSLLGRELWKRRR